MKRNVIITRCYKVELKFYVTNNLFNMVYFSSDIFGIVNNAFYFSMHTMI